MDSSLCSRCQNFDIQSFKRGTSELRGYPLAEFVKSAKSNPPCSFCKLVFQNLEAAERDRTEFSLLKTTVRRHAGDKPSDNSLLPWTTSVLSWMWPPWLNIYAAPPMAGGDLEAGGQGQETLQNAVPPTAGDLEAGGQRQEAMQIRELRAFVGIVAGTEVHEAGPEIQLLAAADSGTPAYESGDIVGRIETDSYSWDQYKAESLKKWHKMCVQSHDNCKFTMSRRHEINPESVLLPTRCIEIEMVPASAGSGDSPLQPKFALRETKNQYGRYIAISHRWDGNTNATKTTSDNYTLRMEECPGTALFYDAARIAHSLGIKHIWIDSLCIKQDKEWETESVKMADYYQHAWLTIAAPVRYEGGGLFGDPQPGEIAPLARLPYRDRQGVQRGYFYLQCISQKALGRDYSENVGRGPLFRRGWVYQEWMLSRRLLTFSHGSVFVRCSEGLKALAGGTVELPDGDNSRQTANRASRPSIFSDLTSHSQVELAWENVVETYSILEITEIEEDRLVALAGVAKEFGEAIQALQGAGGADPLGDTSTTGAEHWYLCGLWVFYPEGLLWEQVPSGPGRCARLRGIPTWSWASMEMGPPSAPGAARRGLGVRWSEKQRETRKSRKQRVECEIVKAIKIPVDKGEWVPRLERREAEDVVSQKPSEYGNNARFFALCLRGRLLKTLVHGFFQSKEDMDIAATLTGYSLDFGRHLWRRVTTVEEPGSIVGWASLEHPEWQDFAQAPLPEDPSQGQRDQDDGSGEDQRQQQSRQSRHLFAFVVTSIPGVSGGFGFGNLTGRQTAFKVLYLARKAGTAFGEDCFERVGTGRLCGNEAEALFRGAEPRTLWLV